MLRSSPRLDDYPWLDLYRPYRISPVSLLEMAYLNEKGRFEIGDRFLATLRGPTLRDRRHLSDDPDQARNPVVVDAGPVRSAHRCAQRRASDSVVFGRHSHSTTSRICSDRTCAHLMQPQTNYAKCG